MGIVAWEHFGLVLCAICNIYHNSGSILLSVFISCIYFVSQCQNCSNFSSGVHDRFIPVVFWQCCCDYGISDILRNGLGGISLLLTQHKNIYIYISGGPLSALTCCVNVRLLSAIKKISPLIYSQSWVGSWVYTTQAMMTFTLIF